MTTYHRPSFDEYKGDLEQAFCQEIDKGTYDKCKTVNEFYDEASERAWFIFEPVSWLVRDEWKYQLLVSDAMWNPEFQEYIGEDQYTIPNNPVDTMCLIYRVAFEYIYDYLWEIIQKRLNPPTCPECSDKLSYISEYSVYECQKCWKEFEEYEI